MPTDEYQETARAEKRKARFARALEILNYIILPIQYITKDIFLLFSSYNTALSIALPTLQFMCRHLQWIYGVSFILEGLCALIDSTKNTTRDKRAFLLSQSGLLIAGGIIVTVFAFSAPQIFLPALCAVWATSTIFFLVDLVRDYLKHARSIKLQAQIIHSVKELLESELSETAYINQTENLDFLENLNKCFRKAIQQHDASDIDTIRVKAEIMEKIGILQDKQDYVQKSDIILILDGILNSEKYNPKVSNNNILTTVYLVASFCCALATFIFLGRPDVQQSAIFTHIIITTAMVAKRCWDFITNPLIQKAQFEQVSSKEIDQLDPSSLKERYLKIKLNRLHKTTNRFISSLDNKEAMISLDKKRAIKKIIDEYAKVVLDINPTNHYSLLISEVSQVIGDTEKTSHAEIENIALALDQSISSRLIYLNSNHSCMLCNALKKASPADKPTVSPEKSVALKKTARSTKMFLKPKKAIRETSVKAHRSKSRVSLQALANRCQELLTERAKEWAPILNDDDTSDSDEDKNAPSARNQ